MHASKDSRAALGGSAVVLCLCLSICLFPFFPGGAGGYFTTLASSPPLSFPVLSCTALHCAALYPTLSPPLPSPLPLNLPHTTPRHVTAKEVPYYYVCNTTPRAERPPSQPPAHAHAHTHTQMQTCNAALPNTAALASGRASASASASGEGEVPGRLSSMKL
jgi:hypothetical protein